MREIRMAGITLCVLLTIILIILTVQNLMEIYRNNAETAPNATGNPLDSPDQLNKKIKELQTAIGNEYTRYLPEDDYNFLALVETILEYAQQSHVAVQSYSIGKAENRPLLELSGNASPADMNQFLQKTEAHPVYLDIIQLDANKTGRKLSFQVRIAPAGHQTPLPAFPLSQANNAIEKQEINLNHLFMIPPLKPAPPQQHSASLKLTPSNIDKKIEYDTSYVLTGRYRLSDGSMVYAIKNISEGKMYSLELKKPEAGLAIKAIDVYGILLENNEESFYIKDERQ